MEKLEILRGLALFRGVGGAALQAVAERVVTRRVARQTVLFREGEACRGLYVVAAGRVVAYSAGPDGREQVLLTATAGQAIGELPLFDGAPYPASTRAAEESVVLFLSLEDFHALYRAHPELADAVIRRLGGHLRRLVRLVGLLTLREVPARLAATLLEAAAAAGVPYDGVRVRLGRKHHELAAELATTRESVTRAFMQLRRDGLIAQHGRELELCDVARLRALAGAPALLNL